MAQILVVEDDTFISLFLERKLKELGHVVYTADTTRKAEKIIDQQIKIDIMLLDVILPDESGFDFLERMRKTLAKRHIPVLILSNLGQEHEVERGMKLGAIDFLVKGNYSPQEIANRIEELLKNPNKLQPKDDAA